MPHQCKWLSCVVCHLYNVKNTLSLRVVGYTWHIHCKKVFIVLHSPFQCVQPIATGHSWLFQTCSRILSHILRQTHFPPHTRNLACTYCSNKLKGFHNMPLTVLCKVRGMFNLNLEGLLKVTVPFAFASLYLNPYKVLSLWLECGAIPKTGTINLAIDGKIRVELSTQGFGGQTRSIIW